MKLKFMMTAALLASATYANAAVLTVDTGWQEDTLSARGLPTDGSPWTFTIGSTATLSITDAFVVGDIYTLSGDVTGITTFFAGANDVRATGFYGPSWLSAGYSHFSTVLSAGSYTFSLTGLAEGGIPAGLALRLDSGDLNSAVPEPATWGMMLLGFGLIGGSLRAAKRRQNLTVSYS